jgi:hypothetical protein
MSLKILSPEQAIDLIEGADAIDVVGYTGALRYITNPDEDHFLQINVQDDEGSGYSMSFPTEDNRSIKFDCGMLHLKDEGGTELIRVLRLAVDVHVVDRGSFMAFFRSDDFSEEMSVDDCVELFSQSLKGESDITRELLENVCGDYNADLAAIASSTPIEGFAKTELNGIRVSSLVWDGTKKQAEETLGATPFAFEENESGSSLFMRCGPRGDSVTVRPGDKLFMVRDSFVYLA